MITGFYAGILGILYAVYVVIIGRMRKRYRVSVGDGGNFALARLIRIHGNFAEYVPLAILFLLITEIGQTIPLFYLHFLGGSIVLGRLAHAYGLSNDKNLKFRMGGMLLTLVPILIMSFALICQFIRLWQA